MADELQKHLEKGQYGAPKLNPDEQRRYLGTFRERCYISMTVSQMQDGRNQTLLEKHLADHSDSSLLINGQLPESLQSRYIALSVQAQKKFTIVAGDTSKESDPIGLLVVSPQAVNEEVIDIEKKFNHKEVPFKSTGKKKSFW